MQMTYVPIICTKITSEYYLNTIDSFALKEKEKLENKLDKIHDIPENVEPTVIFLLSREL